jgi:hypothetical protein
MRPALILHLTSLSEGEHLPGSNTFSSYRHAFSISSVLGCSPRLYGALRPKHGIMLSVVMLLNSAQDQDHMILQRACGTLM